MLHRDVNLYKTRASGRLVFTGGLGPQRRSRLDAYKARYNT